MSNARFDVIVVGGGAAGMMAAGQAALRGRRTALIERNPILGKKLGITGKGRCNITNDAELPQLMAALPTNGSFLYSAFSAFAPSDVMAFFETLGVPLKVERGRRVFPQSDRAADIVQALRRWVVDCGVTVRHSRVLEVLAADGAVTGVRLADGVLDADSVILATGGLSYPKTGSTGDGYDMAHACGHTIVPPRASLVPLVADGCAAMQGLSLKNVVLTVTDEHKRVLFDEMGELLFTHFGLSGPLVLAASAHMREWPGRYTAHINMKPALTPEQLDARLLRDMAAHPNKNAYNLLTLLLHASCIPVVLERTGLASDRSASVITKVQRQAVAACVQDFCFTVTGLRPVDEAVITAGGVAVKEIDPKTMQSKLLSGLYVVGELLDVDGYTGGYNLQIAWSTGYAAGCHA